MIQLHIGHYILMVYETPNIRGSKKRKSIEEMETTVAANAPSEAQGE